jgi:hypothetical protein
MADSNAASSALRSFRCRSRSASRSARCASRRAKALPQLLVVLARKRHAARAILPARLQGHHLLDRLAELLCLPQRLGLSDEVLAPADLGLPRRAEALVHRLEKLVEALAQLPFPAKSGKGQGAPLVADFVTPCRDRPEIGALPVDARGPGLALAAQGRLGGGRGFFFPRPLCTDFEHRLKRAGQNGVETLPLAAGRGSGRVQPLPFLAQAGHSRRQGIEIALALQQLFRGLDQVLARLIVAPSRPVAHAAELCAVAAQPPRHRFRQRPRARSCADFPLRFLRFGETAGLQFQRQAVEQFAHGIALASRQGVRLP